IETLIPHGEVASSMLPCRIALIFSRSASSSSSWCWPSTERSVVCAICDVATMKFSTWTIAAFGSTIRKYATAFTRTGTLSFVITSCGGMLSVIVRRSTLTIRSTIGISRKRPGPFGSGSSRPSRKMIPRSYSRATLTAASRKSSRMTATATTATIAAVIEVSPLERWGHRTGHWRRPTAEPPGPRVKPGVVLASVCSAARSAPAAPAPLRRSDNDFEEVWVESVLADEIDCTRVSHLERALLVLPTSDRDDGDGRVPPPDLARGLDTVHQRQH